MKKYDFKGHIVRDPSTTHFAMLSMWDKITEYHYIFRYVAADQTTHRLELFLGFDGLTIAQVTPGLGDGIFDTFYYRMLWTENKPDIDANDVKTLCDYFKIFAGMVWALPVKMIDK